MNPKPKLHESVIQSGESGTRPAMMVFLTPLGYCCGSCQRIYNSRSQAFQCLKDCILKDLFRSGVGIRFGLSGMNHHVCKLCSKSYASMEDAQWCFGICLEERKEGIPEEIRMNLRALATVNLTESVVCRGRVNPRLPPRQSPPRRLEPLQRSIFCKPLPNALKNLSLSDQKPASFSSALRQEVAPEKQEDRVLESSLPSEIPEMTAFPGNQEPVAPSEAMGKEESAYRLPNQKPFKRADAKYECSVCGKKYFTKSEVETCFMAHPLRTEV